MDRRRLFAAARACALILIVLLLCVLWGWQWLRAPTLAHALWAAVASVPILIPLRGIVRANRRTFAWATLCLTPYFTIAVSESIVNASARGWAVAVLGLSVLIFFTLIACLRLGQGSLEAGKLESE
jgi:uncharacterized membrane protein